MSSSATLLLHILAATVIAGMLSTLAVAALSIGWLARLVRQLVSLSAGLLLATAVLHLIPEAIESAADVHALSWTMLAGLVGFFLLEKLAILRHGHHHEADGHGHHHGHDRSEAGPGGLLIVVGDTIHNFVDGVMIAAAFMTDIRLGWLTTVAIAAHEIPQEIGDFIVLLNAGCTRRRAVLFNLLSGAASVVGGIAGFLALSGSQRLLPYAIILSASSFIYIALADLVPDMHRDGARSGAESALQVAWMAAGVAVIALLTRMMHAH